METMLTIDHYNKTCKYDACKKAFAAKRLNQFYCNPECKKKANNGKAREERNPIHKIDKQLKLNRRILEYFYNQGQTEISGDLLKLNHFDYSKITGLNVNKENGNKDPIFYNYSLMQLGNKNFKIIKLW